MRKMAGCHTITRVVATITFTVCGLLFAIGAPLASARGHEALSTQLRHIVARSPQRGIAAVDVVDARSGKTLLAWHASRAVAPASNAKLFTTTAALSTMGPNYRFTTRVALDAPAASAVVTGPLYLIGGGDPSLATDDWAKRNLDGAGGGSMNMLAEQLQSNGIRRIDGGIVVDDSLFDRSRYLPSWKRSFRFYESPALGALTVNHDFFGSYLHGASSHRPAIFAGQTLRTLLRSEGISVHGSIRFGHTPTSATVLATTQSPALSQILRFMDTHSDNFTAETIMRDLAAVELPSKTATTALGLRAARHQLAIMGVPGRIRLIDGSGLSLGNRTTPRQIVSLLEIVAKNRTLGPMLRAELAVSGGRGTLQSRLSHGIFRGKLVGKTGTLNNASALSGYVTGRSGREYIMSAISWRRSGWINNADAHTLQDAIAATLVSSG